MHLLAIAGRVAVVYVLCMALLRVSRREMSELGPMDLLTMLLLSETVSPALTGGDNSMAGGVVAAVTLLGLSVASQLIGFRSPRAERLLQGRAMVLIEDGRVDADVMQKFLITPDDLKVTLHKQGLLDVDEVKRAFVEADGAITVIRRDH